MNMTHMKHFKQSLLFTLGVLFLFVTFMPVWADKTIERFLDVVAKDFYTWYLKALSLDNFEAIDSSHLSKYVARGLIQEIKAQENSPDGIDEDYFTKAQDYLDDWVNNVSLSNTNTQKNNATSIVTLGRSDKVKLSVSFIKEENEWKIRKVHKI